MTAEVTIYRHAPDSLTAEELDEYDGEIVLEVEYRRTWELGGSIYLDEVTRDGEPFELTEQEWWDVTGQLLNRSAA